MADDTIAVEVVYAEPEKQVLRALLLPAGTTVAGAIDQSRLNEEFPQVNFSELKFGIFGRHCAADRVLRDGDRIELYRPLKADPKAVRRKLAAEGKTMGRKR